MKNIERETEVISRRDRGEEEVERVVLGIGAF